MKKSSLIIGGTQGVGIVIRDVLRERGDMVTTASRRKIKSKTKREKKKIRKF